MAAPAPAAAVFAVRAVLVDDVGRVLVLLRPAGAAVAPGTWCLPGGAVELAENPEAAAARELREETGLSADYTGISIPYAYDGGSGRAFLFRYPEGEQAHPAREVADARWVSPNDLPRPMMPGHAEAIAALAGTGERAMRDLDLTSRRRQLEDAAGRAVAPWLEAMVRELAGLLLGDRLAKSVHAPEAWGAPLEPGDPMHDAIRARFAANEAADRERVARIHDALDTDGLGEQAFMKILTRAVKAGRAEAARAIMLDARRGSLPPGQRGYREKTMAALGQVARRHLRQVAAATERRLAAIAMQPEAADVQTMLAKLYDTYRSDLIGQNLVAEGYVNGVADVLRDYGYKHVWARTMGDDRTCAMCRHFETTPSLAKMTIQQFLRRFPLHPRCRCWPAPSPTAAIADLAWRDPRARIIQKGLTPMSSALAQLAALVDEPDDDLAKGMPAQNAMLLREIAGKRNRNGGKFAPGKVTADDPKAARKPAADAPPSKGKGGAKAGDMLKRAGAAAKAEQGAPAKPKPGGGGGAKPGAAAGKVNTKSPDHLIQAGHGMLQHLRTLEPGSEEHGHVLNQYNAIRAGIKTWNATDGATANPGDGVIDGGNVKNGEPPAFLGEGAGDRLKTPRQFEIAATQAETREDAIELAHYFERMAHNNGHAGAHWDAAWGEIKASIKALPTKAQAAAGVDGKGKPLPVKAPELQPGLEAQKASDEYGGHLDELNGHGDRAGRVGATRAEKDAAHADYIAKLDEVAAKTGKRAVDIVSDASKRRADQRDAQGDFIAAEPGKGERKGGKAGPKKPAGKPAAAAPAAQDDGPVTVQEQEPREPGTPIPPDPTSAAIAHVAGAEPGPEQPEQPEQAGGDTPDPEQPERPESAGPAGDAGPAAPEPAPEQTRNKPKKPRQPKAKAKPDATPKADDKPSPAEKPEKKGDGRRILDHVMDHFGTMMAERDRERLEK